MVGNPKMMACFILLSLSAHYVPRPPLPLREHFTARSPIIVVSRPMHCNRFFSFIAHDIAAQISHLLR
jgi:hypothetical protein